MLRRADIAVAALLVMAPVLAVAPVAVYECPLSATGTVTADRVTGGESSTVSRDPADHPPLSAFPRPDREYLRRAIEASSERARVTVCAPGQERARWLRFDDDTSRWTVAHRGSVYLITTSTTDAVAGLPVVYLAWLLSAACLLAAAAGALRR